MLINDIIEIQDMFKGKFGKAEATKADEPTDK
jgi:hypothetical protein